MDVARSTACRPDEPAAQPPLTIRLHVLSDLHLEREAFTAPEVEADVVVLAGDIARGPAGITWARSWAGDTPVLFLAGNHEFYGHSLPGLLGQLRDAAAGSTVRVLENNEVVIDDVRFLGATLWSDFDFDGPERRGASMALCRRAVNDYTHIRFDPEDRVLAPPETRAVHLASRAWLTERLAQPFDGRTVVITHHAPLVRGRPPLPELRAIAGAFASDLTDLMGGERVPLWIYGHTHRTADVDVRGTRVISNPRGYAHQPVAGFDPAFVAEV